MEPKRFQSLKFSPFIVKFKKLGFTAPLIVISWEEGVPRGAKAG